MCFFKPKSIKKITQCNQYAPNLDPASLNTELENEIAKDKMEIIRLKKEYRELSESLNDLNFTY